MKKFLIALIAVSSLGANAFELKSDKRLLEVELMTGVKGVMATYCDESDCYVSSIIERDYVEKVQSEIKRAKEVLSRVNLEELKARAINELESSGEANIHIESVVSQVATSTLEIEFIFDKAIPQIKTNINKEINVSDIKKRFSDALKEIELLGDKSYNIADGIIDIQLQNIKRLYLNFDN